MFGLYKVQNPADRASQMMDGAKGAFAAMQQQRDSKTETKLLGPTIGGAVGAGIGGAAAGAMLAKEIAVAGLTPGIGAAVLAPLAIGAYLFS